MAGWRSSTRPLRAELKQLEGRGHSLVIDDGWREVATAVLVWLKDKGL
jgi:hypothetical protein